VTQVPGHWWRLAVTAAVLTGIAAWSARLSLFRINQDTFDDNVVSAIEARQIEQTFDSHYPGLAAINVRLIEPFPPSGQPVTLRLFELFPDPHERLSLTGPLSQFEAGGELHFAFAPLDDSAARRYRLAIATPGPRPLFLRANHFDLYPPGEMTGGGDLVFAVRYNGWLMPTLAAFLSRLAENKPGLLGQRWLYVVLAAVCGATVLLTLARLARPDRGHAAARRPIGPDQSADR
jgi:hypothetical protein